MWELMLDYLENGTTVLGFCDPNVIERLGDLKVESVRKHKMYDEPEGTYDPGMIDTN